MKAWSAQKSKNTQEINSQKKKKKKSLQLKIMTKLWNLYSTIHKTKHHIGLIIIINTIPNYLTSYPQTLI